MYMLDYNYFKLLQQERLRDAEKQRRVTELLQEARAGELSSIVRSWERQSQPEQKTTDARRAPAV